MDDFTSNGNIAGGGVGVNLVYSTFLCCVLVNLNSLVNKVNFVENFIRVNNVDIMNICESWLNCEINDNIINVAGYNLIRNDSPSGIRKHGVATYIRDNIKYNVVQTNVPNLICVYLLDLKVYCLNIYRPPSSNAEENANLIHFLSDFVRDKEVCILGDFNLPSINWIDESYLNEYILPGDRRFLDAFTDLGLTQMVNEATNFPSGSTIDLCLVSAEERISSCEVLPPFPHCSHGVVKILYTFQNRAADPCEDDGEENNSRGKRVWTKANFNGMRSLLSQIDWAGELSTIGVQDQYIKFLTVAQALEERFVPLYSPRNSRGVPWALNPLET